ncbi:hypothetical protein LSTR_LSTR014370 [Laodelphax striatellus]|uniref:diphthine methyl ester synthase n=1 Tax=Laodelphax striatellus TaxID=195883 RepID=A0A482WQ20_LAOST|nr:hypothetical protein LSTR_LSTR014370 [Laodelphax striatellus]
MLYIIGLGLGDEKDITCKGLEAVKKADRVYLEEYTSILTVGKRALEAFYERDDLIVADRELVEQGDEILRDADSADVAFLVVGDPFGATTHSDLALRAKNANIRCRIIHNASIMNAIGCTGLQLYSFGETVSIPFWTETWQPDSFYDKIIGNLSRGLHTLCLLDIKVKEPTLESLTRKKREYEPPRFMTVNQAASQLLQIIEQKQSTELSTEKRLSAESVCIAVSRVGSSDQKMVSTTLKQMTDVEMGPPLHSLVIAGTLHPLEQEYISEFAL